MPNSAATFQSANPDHRARITRELNAQGVTPLLDIVIDQQEPGCVTLSMPIMSKVVQQYQVVHGGMVAVIADSASGLAAFHYYRRKTACCRSSSRSTCSAPVAVSG